MQDIGHIRMVRADLSFAEHECLLRGCERSGVLPRARMVTARSWSRLTSSIGSHPPTGSSEEAPGPQSSQPEFSGWWGGWCCIGMRVYPPVALPSHPCALHDQGRDAPGLAQVMATGSCSAILACERSRRVPQCSRATTPLALRAMVPSHPCALTGHGQHQRLVVVEFSVSGLDVGLDREALGRARGSQ